MTTLTTPTSPVTRTAGSPSPSVLARCATAAPDVLTVATLLYGATGLTWGVGGRSPRVLSFAVVLLALIAVRPWNVLPRSASALGFALGLAAFGVVATAPTADLDVPVSRS